MEGMTASDATEGKPTATPCPKTGDRLYCVLRASGLKPTGRQIQGRNERPIAFDEFDQHPFHEVAILLG